jgi:DNA replication and repair protein RecF
MSEGLHAQRLELVDWRSFEERVVDFDESLTILCGPNAHGKTNTVEALQLCTAGVSFRRPRPLELVRTGAEAARATLHLRGDGRVIETSCLARQGARRFRRNDKPCAPADVPQMLRSVVFTPDDLSFVKRGAKVRREELDDFARQVSPGYAKVLSSYQRAVEQRNRLLKELTPDLLLLDAWDASVALGGATLLHARLRIFERLVPKLVAIYGRICDGEALSCDYVATLGEDASALSRKELSDRFLDRLQAARDDDLRRQQTTVGPHRDDVTFALDGRDARTFGSQGQQRSIVLAWKMAEVELAEEILDEKPLLLLDDVMSELDERRRAAVVSFVQSGIQTVVTTTNLGYFAPELIAGARVIDY